MTTSMDRVMAALSGERTDRPAVSMTLSLYGAGLTGCPLEPYYTDPEAYFQGQAAVQDRFSPDILFAPFAVPLYGRAFGSGIRFYDNYPPNLVRPVAPSAEDLDQVTLPDPETRPELIFFIDSVRRMAGHFGHQTPVAAIALDPLSLPIMIMGLDGWLQTFLFQPDIAERWVERTLPFFHEWVDLLMQAGSAFVVMPTAFVTPAILTRDLVIERCLPLLKKAFGAVQAPLVMHSTGAPLSPFLDLFAPLPNVKGFVIHSRDSFQEAREWVGKRTLLLGNLEGPDFNRLSVDRVRKKCRRLLDDRRDDPFFIPATSAADIPLDTPAEVILAMRESIEEAGHG